MSSISTIETKKLTLNGKTLTLKAINQLLFLDLSMINEFECLGFYNVKNVKHYIFSNGNELRYFIDRDWSVIEGKNIYLFGRKNRHKTFNNKEDRDSYYHNYKITIYNIIDEQLFY